MEHKHPDDHELIKIKQIILAQSYSNANPSEVTDVYWIFAKNEKDNYPKSTSNSGKWLVFVNFDEVDNVWDKIKTSTQSGKLGGSSKVATAKLNPNATDTKTKVICVYTYDWTDEDDIRRIREELRALGITKKIPYKADEDTLQGKYVKRGNTRISKYYE